MVGNFLPNQTGESRINNIAFKVLSKAGLSVSKIEFGYRVNDDFTNDGVIGLLKVLHYFKVFFKVFIFKFHVRVLYCIPGQSRLGIYKTYFLIKLFKLFKRKSKIYIHWHGYGLYNQSRKDSWICNALLSEADLQIFLSVDFERKIREKFKANFKSTILPNTALCEFLDFENDLFPFKNKNVLEVTYLGNLIESKGYKNLLSIASQLTSIRINICGSGTTKEVNQLKLAQISNPNLVYHGFVDDSLKSKILINTDILVLQTSYKNEGLPVSLIEGCFYGCAIVTTEHNSIKDVFLDNAMYVDKYSVEELATCLKFLDSNRKQLIVQQRKAYSLRNQFAPQLFEDSLLRIFRETLQ